MFSLQIKYECVPGFSLVGKDTRYCQKDGTWTPSELPTCVPVQCGLPESPVNGKAHYTALVRPKPLFWFRSDTKTKTQIGQYFWPIPEPIPEPQNFRCSDILT